LDSFNSAYTNNPGFPIKEEYYKPTIRSESEGNYIHVRARSSRGRHKWELKWDYIDDSDYQSIKDFFDKNQGIAFYWTNPVDNQTYTVVFADNNLNAEAVSPGYWNLSIKLEEV